MRTQSLVLAVILSGLSVDIWPGGVASLLRAADATDLFSDPLPGTERLDWQGDLASRLLDGAHRFADRKLVESVSRRASHWHRDMTSAEAYNASLAKKREDLAHILGLRDARLPARAPRVVFLGARDPRIAVSDNFVIHEIQWDSVGGMLGEGLLLVPNQSPRGLLVFLPDADQTPEMVCGLDDSEQQVAKIPLRMADQGYLVVVPALVSRSRQPIDWHGRKYAFTHREFLYRSAYELGRHIIGYELQSILAVVDGLEHGLERRRTQPSLALAEQGYAANAAGDETLPVAIWGYGEGGMLALYAAALDQRFQVAGVSGYFNNRNELWKQPIDRNVFGLLDQFGDAEIATMIAPRKLIVEACQHPTFELPTGTGGAPARLETPADDVVAAEVQRALDLTAGASWESSWLRLVGRGADAFGSEDAWQAFMQSWHAENLGSQTLPTPQRIVASCDAWERNVRLIRDMDRFSQECLRESQFVRQAFMQNLKTDSLEDYAQSVEHYRDYFRHEVVGHFDDERLPPHPRTRKLQESDKVVYYEVVLDVFPDVFAYGILCLPKDLQANEKRPVVVCQHGLEGRPQSTIGEKDHGAYKAFATALAERGFITFAPQNLYIFEDRFRGLQRKLYPLKKTLFSIIVPQHQQIVDWLQSQPFVDPDRVAFYGLSYGGKTAMRVPPLVTDYCLSICSADFNEWVDKNASTRNPRSYVWSSEYEIFEWDLGSTFNYAEMAALIAPRPFMVERGHFDGVADDWTVAWEFAKVRNLYAARLHLEHGCEIEWFVGPHTINGQGTFQFLHRHLKWPQRP